MVSVWVSNVDNCFSTILNFLYDCGLVVLYMALGVFVDGSLFLLFLQVLDLEGDNILGGWCYI